MTIALEVLFIAHVFYYTVLCFIMSRPALYIPIAKPRGFTAHFGNGFPTPRMTVRLPRGSLAKSYNIVYKINVFVIYFT
jgi:hypothetical protein